ncbi:MAG: biotin--[acetyl-CoA-carboxylase] ligase, partial [Planctomycetes bacterium]|nr:biotin--[acetyl-CoA-carboxylase] ligase [Planctomycetota bacterium]
MIDVSLIKPKCKLLKPKVLFFDEVTSTNEVAWKHLSAENAQNNVVVIADVQSKGKGRFSRTWYSPSGENLYLSILLNISIPLDRIHLITAIGALAALDTVAENTASGKACIVFPNDVHINGKKISGVLAECKLISGNPDAFVLGIGVNVNTIKFPSEIVSLATSLKLLENKPFELEKIATTLLERIDHYYSC